MPSSRKRSYSPNRYQTVRVANLPEDYALSHLTKLFSSFGHVKDIRLVECDGARHGLVDLEMDDVRPVLKHMQLHGWEVSFAERSYDNKPLIWSGFFSRNRSRKVGVDAYLLEGDFKLDHRQYHIDIPYRIPLTNLDMYTVKALLILQAENCTHIKQFNEYVKYFSCKERAGYTSISASHDLVLLPYCAKALGIAPLLRNDQMLGLVVEKQQ